MVKVSISWNMQYRQVVAIVVVLVVTPLSRGIALPVAKNDGSVDLLMPNVQPQMADTYLCHGLKIGPNAMHIVGFQPHASMRNAHHVLIYGCAKPGSDKSSWDCGEMHSASSKFQNGPVCASGSQIIYAWAMDAPELHLPEGVGFKVGGDTGINWLVLQVHYMDVTPFTAPNNGTDASGVTLITSSASLPRRAGVYLMGTGGEIPPNSVTYMETACSYSEPFIMHPFAFRTHAHTHGRVVSGYRIRDGVWLEIGRMSPQKPQMFYNITNPGMTVKSGDILAARCTMENTESRAVQVGSTSNDEMCNFYIMYFVDGDRNTITDSYCFTDGPPTWDWTKFDDGLIDAALAPLAASVVPGTEDYLAATDWFAEDRQRVMLDADRLGDIISSIAARSNDDAMSDDGQGFEDEAMNGDVYNYPIGN